MAITVLWEKHYPWVAFAVSIICFYPLYNCITFVENPVVAMSGPLATFGAIVTGFIGATKGILIALSRTYLADAMQRTGGWDSLIRFFTFEIYASLALAAAGIIGVAIKIKAGSEAERLTMSLYVGLSVMVFTGLYRVMRLFSNLMRQPT